MKNRIRVERAELGLTQEQVAEKIGVSRQTINAIEKGRYAPSVVLALKLARLLESELMIFLNLRQTIKQIIINDLSKVLILMCFAKEQ